MARNFSVSVTKTNKHILPGELKKKLKGAVEKVLSGEGVLTQAEISIVITNDVTIRQLNKRFLNHDYPTDVLSFRLSDDEPTKCGHLVGEIIISVETAERNAKKFKQTLERELTRLVIHGTLHLLGYDDATPSQRQKMRRKEEKYLKVLGV